MSISCRPYLLLSDSAKEEFDTLQAHDNAGDDHHDYDAVVVGLAPNQFDYHHLNTAFRILTGEHASRSPLPSNDSHRTPPLIATHKAKYLESTSPPGLSLGPGPFVAALEYAAGVEAHVLGKPTKEFFAAVIDSLPQHVHEAVGKIAIVGDDVEADLGGGAIGLGLWRVLGESPPVVCPLSVLLTSMCLFTVRTGKYRPGDEYKQGVTPPDEVYDSLAQFVDTLLGLPSHTSLS